MQLSLLWIHLSLLCNCCHNIHVETNLQKNQLIQPVSDIPSYLAEKSPKNCHSQYDVIVHINNPEVSVAKFLTLQSLDVV